MCCNSDGSDDTDDGEKWLINENDVEMVVLLRGKNVDGYVEAKK